MALRGRTGVPFSGGLLPLPMCYVISHGQTTDNTASHTQAFQDQMRIRTQSSRAHHMSSRIKKHPNCETAVRIRAVTRDRLATRTCPCLAVTTAALVHVRHRTGGTSHQRGQRIIRRSKWPCPPLDSCGASRAVNVSGRLAVTPAQLRCAGKGLQPTSSPPSTG